jgi:hypothetical protein
MHSQGANITTWEEQWLYNKRIRRNCQASAVDTDDCLVIKLLESSASERGQKYGLNQFGA